MEKDVQEQHKKILVSCLSILLITGIILANEIYRPHAASEDAKTVEITPGLGSRKIGALLKKEGIIRSKWAFVIYVSLRGEASSLKPGIYTFKKAAIPEIADILVHNKKTGVSITIPEGWTKEEIAAYLKRENI